MPTAAPPHPIRGAGQTNPHAAAGAWIGFGASAALIGLITLTPQSPTSAHGSVSRAILDFLYRAGLPKSFTYVHWEFTANVIMFLPLGFFLALTLLGRKRTTRPQVIWRLLLLPATSGFIETAQLLFLPSRYPTWSDIIANTTGGWIGFLVGLGAVWAVARKSQRLPV